MTLKVLVTPGEDRGFVAQVPALRGCWSQGTTRAEALANIGDAIVAWLEVEQDKGDTAPSAADVELVSV